MGTKRQDLESFREEVLSELRRLNECLQAVQGRLDGLAEREGAAALLLERLESAERRRRELGDQALHLVELLGDARRGLALAEEAARRAGQG